MVIKEMTCRRCGLIEVPKLGWKEAGDFSHLGAYCAECGAWIKWVKQTEEIIEWMNGKVS